MTKHKVTSLKIYSFVQRGKQRFFFDYKLVTKSTSAPHAHFFVSISKASTASILEDYGVSSSFFGLWRNFLIPSRISRVTFEFFWCGFLWQKKGGGFQNIDGKSALDYSIAAWVLENCCWSMWHIYQYFWITANHLCGSYAFFFISQNLYSLFISQNLYSWREFPKCWWKISFFRWISKLESMFSFRCVAYWLYLHRVYLFVFFVSFPICYHIFKIFYETEVFCCNPDCFKWCFFPCRLMHLSGTKITLRNFLFVQ